ncbi:dTMP kinase, partial [Streptomyces alkaliphilus]|nr:dTMP kinase [Streptomyces alkaliphilus]
MTRAEEPGAASPAGGVIDEALATESRERAPRALLRLPTLRRLWEAQLAGGTADVLALLVLLVLTFQAAAVAGALGGGERGVVLSLALLLAVRIGAGVLVGTLLLDPLAKLVSADGPLDRRWTLVGADGVRVVALVLAPLWVDWTPGTAWVWLLVTALVLAVAERVWTITRDAAAPALLPPPPPEGDA